MNRGYVIYAQDRDGACGYVKRGKVDDYSIDGNLIADFNDDVLVFPTKEAAEARIKTYNSHNRLKNDIEYITIMYFDGQQVNPLEA